MKTTTFLTSFAIIAVQFAFSQSQNWWRIDGNNASGNHFIGTTNNQGLNFRTNNQNRLQILPNGQLRFNSFALGNTGLLTYDATGLLTPLAFDGIGDMVLSNNGSFVPVSSFSNWSLNGNFLYTQNYFVGIGTSTPVAPLTVAGDALFTGSITTSGLNVLQKIEADTIRGVIRVDVNGSIMLGEEDGYNGITSRQDDLRINSRPGFDHNVVISANTSGNVGIGTSNPQYKLHVLGNTAVNGLLYADSLQTINFSTNQMNILDSLKIGTNSIWLGGFNQFTGLNNHIYADNGALVLQSQANPVSNPNIPQPSRNVITNMNSGNFGIGTTTPETKLHIRGVTCSTCPFPPQSPQDPDLTTYITLEDHIQNSSGQTVSNTKWRLAASANQDRFFITKNGLNSGVFTIDGSGNVGIGTTTPGQNYSGDLKLDVNGDARFYRNNNSDDYISIGYNSANATLDMGGEGSLLINYYSNKDVIIGNSAAPDPANLFVTGRMGVGKGPDASYRLDVAGSMRACEIVVEPNWWCDYVFEDDYERMNWQEKQKFVMKNKHLPGVLSEKVISEHGMGVGETMAGILLNTEENTLDIIDIYKQLEDIKIQQEYIDNLKEENKNLKSAIEEQNKKIETLSKLIEDIKKN
jgi:hypothetical protein